MKITVFLDVMSCGLVKFTDFWMNTLPPSSGLKSKPSDKLKIDAASFSETPVNYQTTRRHIPKDSNLHSHSS
jgi:hypothetical protein